MSFWCYTVRKVLGELRRSGLLTTPGTRMQVVNISATLAADTVFVRPAARARPTTNQRHAVCACSEHITDFCLQLTLIRLEPSVYQRNEGLFFYFCCFEYFAYGKLLTRAIWLPF